MPGLERLGLLVPCPSQAGRDTVANPYPVTRPFMEGKILHKKVGNAIQETKELLAMSCHDNICHVPLDMFLLQYHVDKPNSDARAVNISVCP